MNQYRSHRALLLTICSGLATTGAAGRSAAASLGGLFDQPATQRSEFLPVEKAFRVSAVALGPEQIRVTWVIAPGYYLYQKRLKFSATATGVKLSPVLPKGESHTDEYFGTQVVYREVLPIAIGVARSTAAVQTLTLSVGYQGCADAGLCYPPQTTQLKIAMPRGSAGIRAATTSP
jgi:thiol:disulfide interchange protein DsbD